MINPTRHLPDTDVRGSLSPTASVRLGKTHSLLQRLGFILCPKTLADRGGWRMRYLRAGFETWNDLRERPLCCMEKKKQAYFTWHANLSLKKKKQGPDRCIYICPWSGYGTCAPIAIYIPPPSINFYEETKHVVCVCVSERTRERESKALLLYSHVKTLLNGQIWKYICSSHNESKSIALCVRYSTRLCLYTSPGRLHFSAF